MPHHNAINWEDFKETYNRIHKTQYKSAVDWIADLYEKHNKFVSPLAEELGVGNPTVRNYLKRIGIFVQQPKGGARDFDRTGPREKLFLSIPEKTMLQLTANQICERCGMNDMSGMYKMARKFGRKYKRKRCGRPSKRLDF